MLNTIKRFWALCLDTHMKLALYKYAIIIIIIINLMAISLEISQPSVTKISLKDIILIVYWNLPGANELTPTRGCSPGPSSIGTRHRLDWLGLWWRWWWGGQGAGFRRHHGGGGSMWRRRLCRRGHSLRLDLGWLVHDGLGYICWEKRKRSWNEISTH